FQYPPSFVKVPQPIEGLKGKDVSLYCEMRGTAPFQITWFKDRKPLMEGRKYKMVNEGSSATLHVIGIESSDASEYECKVSNTGVVVLTDCVLFVTSEPPYFVESLEPMEVTTGDGVCLKCQVAGTPEIKVSWFKADGKCRVAGSSPVEVSWLKDGEPLRPGDEFSMLYDDNTAVLEISRGEKRHSGEYTCVANNSVGSASCRAKLTLQGLCILLIGWFNVRV
uniref:Ig-like domain-containing protein n=1 Tax=Cyclopterus lumpus TaxID=8103 RepID=A0A8C2ZMT1_CYCLU